MAHAWVRLNYKDVWIVIFKVGSARLWKDIVSTISILYVIIKMLKPWHINYISTLGSSFTEWVLCSFMRITGFVWRSGSSKTILLSSTKKPFFLRHTLYVHGLFGILSLHQSCEIHNSYKKTHTEECGFFLIQRPLKVYKFLGYRPITRTKIPWV